MAWRLKAGLDVHAEGRYYVRACVRVRVRACARAPVCVRACACVRVLVSLLRARACSPCLFRTGHGVHTHRHAQHNGLSTKARLPLLDYSHHRRRLSCAKGLRACEERDGCAVWSLRLNTLTSSLRARGRRSAKTQAALRTRPRCCGSCNAQHIHATGNVQCATCNRQQATDIRHEATASNMQGATCSMPRQRTRQ